MASWNQRRSLVVAALAAWAVVAGPAPAGATPPAILFTSETCDLGSVVQGELPSCDFTFSNGGSEDLSILQVEPSCGCTTTLLSAKLLRGGERGGLRVVLDSDNFAGEVVKEVEVRSNDPARGSVTLRVKALIEPEIVFEPATVAFDNVRAGAALKQVVMLTNRRAEAVRVLRLEAQPSSYRCTIPVWHDRSQPLPLESWDRVPLEVALTPAATPTMAIAGECTLEIEGPRKRQFRLKLLALPAP